MNTKYILTWVFGLAAAGLVLYAMYVAWGVGVLDSQKRALAAELSSKKSAYSQCKNFALVESPYFSSVVLGIKPELNLLEVMELENEFYAPKKKECAKVEEQYQLKYEQIVNLNSEIKAKGWWSDFIIGNTFVSGAPVYDYEQELSPARVLLFDSTRIDRLATEEEIRTFLNTKLQEN